VSRYCTGRWEPPLSSPSDALATVSPHGQSRVLRPHRRTTAARESVLSLVSLPPPKDSALVRSCSWPRICPPAISLPRRRPPLLPAHRPPSEATSKVAASVALSRRHASSTIQLRIHLLGDFPTASVRLMIDTGTSHHRRVWRRPRSASSRRRRLSRRGRCTRTDVTGARSHAPPHTLVSRPVTPSRTRATRAPRARDSLFLFLTILAITSTTMMRTLTPCSHARIPASTVTHRWRHRQWPRTTEASTTTLSECRRPVAQLILSPAGMVVAPRQRQ
jgi:hypothetical protein